MKKAAFCADCQVEMEGGFIPDHHAQTIRSHWHPGPGTDTTFFGNLKLENTLLIPITAYRCPQCGLLKQYAAKSDS